MTNHRMISEDAAGSNGRLQRPVGPAYVWIAALVFLAGMAVGYFQVANRSRTTAFLSGESLGVYETACMTDSALLWLLEDSTFTSTDAGQVRMLLSDIGTYGDGLSDRPMTEAFGSGRERAAAEIYKTVDVQLSIAPFRYVGSWGPMNWRGRDIRPQLEAVTGAWYGTDPGTFWGEWSLACGALQS